MISLFEKRLFIKDQLEGFVDIHNHLLPGIDDGAATSKDSLELIGRMGEMGIKNFIATPHIMNDYYPNTPETINSSLQELKSALAAAGVVDVQIRAAAEYMMDHSFLELLKDEKLLTLTDNIVLVEMSYFQPPINLNEILFKLQAGSYKPLLAHPERYAYYFSKDLAKFRDLKNRGCLFQLNILSLAGHYGKHIQQMAFKLIEEKLIDFIGTDTHQMRHLDRLAVARLPKRKMREVFKIISKTKETFMTSFS